MQRKKNEKRKRRAYTAADLAELWDRWGRGESSKTIARVMDRGGVGVHGAVAARRHPPASPLRRATGVNAGRERRRSREASPPASHCAPSPRS